MDEIKKGRISTTIHFTLKKDILEEDLDKIIEDALNKASQISQTEVEDYISEDTSDVA